MGPQRIDILVLDDFSNLTLAALVEPLRVANRMAGRRLRKLCRGSRERWMMSPPRVLGRCAATGAWRSRMMALPCLRPPHTWGLRVCRRPLKA
jgi:transcriptional regulator GlxA family with amidase domain